MCEPGGLCGEPPLALPTTLLGKQHAVLASLGNLVDKRPRSLGAETDPLDQNHVLLDFPLAQDHRNCTLMLTQASLWMPKQVSPVACWDPKEDSDCHGDLLDPWAGALPLAQWLSVEGCSIGHRWVGSPAPTAADWPVEN